MPNYKKIAKAAIKALEKIVERHDKDAELALGTAEEEGMP